MLYEIISDRKRNNKMMVLLYDMAWALTISFVICILAFTFLFKAVSVDGNSMLPTLHNKQILLITNIAAKPEYGDIIVFRKAEHSEHPLVKRVIATGGQRVGIDFRTGDVAVNGRRLDEPYIMEKISPQDMDSVTFTVPEGKVFVLGDNRNNSVDSRRLGMIDLREVLGRMVLEIT